MDPCLLWDLFVETGAPELYLFYRMARREAEPISA